MACVHWAGDGCTVPGCDAGEVGPVDASASLGLPAGWGLPSQDMFGFMDRLDGDRASVVDELRALLVEWERFGRTMADAGVIAIPDRLLGRTVGLLDATAC